MSTFRYDTFSSNGQATTEDDEETVEATTWEAVDLGPYLDGSIALPTPTRGLVRTDGVRFLYPGAQHSIIGETESGKTWFALGCVVAELAAGNTVAYIHFEEANPASTVERLLLLGAPPDAIRERLRFAAPSQPLRDTGWYDLLLGDPVPSLVALDGVNEGMSLHGLDVNQVDGASAFRRLFVTPATRKGACTLACDHVAKNRGERARDEIGSIHKGNAVDGARFQIENTTPFGRNLRGASNFFVTKDRPGHLRAHGKPTNIPGKTYMGTLVADASDPFNPFSLTLYPPRDDGGQDQPEANLADAMEAVIRAAGTVESTRALYAAMRAANHSRRNSEYQTALDELLHVRKSVVTFRGERSRSIGYELASIVSQESTQ